MALSIVYTFESTASLADHLEAKAKDLREAAEKQRTKASALELRAEAYGYERAAHVVRCSKFEPKT